MFRIAFGSDSNKIYVHPNFKFILLTNPTSAKQLDVLLLNRFEKHHFEKN